MKKRIIIEIEPSLDIRQPDGLSCKVEGLEDPLQVLAILQDTQTNILRQMREGARVVAEMQAMAEAGAHIRRH